MPQQDKRLLGLDCTIFGGSKDSIYSKLPVYHASYQLWHQQWLKIFSNQNSPESLDPQNFYRQNTIIALHDLDQVLGTIMSTHFDVRSPQTYQNPYIQCFPKDFIERIRHRAQGAIITSEYLYVDPSIRKSLVGYSVAEVLIGLLMKDFFYSSAYTVLGTAVRTLGVHKNVAKFGYSQLGAKTKYGLDCLLVFNNRKLLVDHPDPRVNEVIDSFWEKRTDLRKLYDLSVNRGSNKQAA